VNFGVQAELVAIDMDEKGFRANLERRRLDLKTVRAYIHHAKKIEKWLSKNLDEATGTDIRRWANAQRGELKSFSSYVSAIRAYYQYVPIKGMLEEIDSIPPIGRPPRRNNIIPWCDFKDVITEVEKEGTNEEYLIILNLLWSEMHPNEILQLRVSDIDFDRYIITSHLSSKPKTYYATKEAWGALKRRIPSSDIGKTGHLLEKIRSVRSIQGITETYFGKLGLKPKDLRRSCLEDLKNAGRTVRFVTNTVETMPKEEPLTKPPIIAKNLFDKLVQEIMNFGERVHHLLPKCREKDLQRLLEGYILATFPDEAVSHEFSFKHSRIDVTFGTRPSIPIEVKLSSENEKIRNKIGQGSEQANEFLKASGSRKGILVIVDRKHDPETKREYNGTWRNDVYVIVI
jgi:integrase